MRRSFESARWVEFSPFALAAVVRRLGYIYPRVVGRVKIAPRLVGEGGFADRGRGG